MSPCGDLSVGDLVAEIKQNVTCRIKGEPDFYTTTLPADVMIAVECARMVTRVTGRVISPENIEITDIDEYEAREQPDL